MTAVPSPPPLASSAGTRLATAHRLVLLGSLYFAQGMPFGFFQQVLPVLLEKQGISLSKIGLAGLLNLPWALKFAWAPLVDRWHWPRLGRRRSWILPMQLASLATLLVLAALPPDSPLTPLMIGTFFMNLCAATQDIATDGLAVEVLPARERGFANGLQVAGYRLGMFFGGGLLLLYYVELGRRGIFLAMALFTALASAPVWALREAATPLRPSAAPLVAPHFLRLPGVGRVLAVIAIYKAGAYLATGMLRPFLSSSGMTVPEIGKLLGVFGFLAGLAGALAGGAAVGRLGRRKALLIFGVCQAVAVAGFAALAFGRPSTFHVYAVCTAEHFASGLGTASLFTAMMDWSRPERAATDYTVQASVVVIATSLAAIASGFLAQAVGYGATFAAAAAFCLVGVAVTAALFPRRGFAGNAGHDAG